MTWAGGRRRISTSHEVLMDVTRAARNSGSVAEPARYSEACLPRHSRPHCSEEWSLVAASSCSCGSAARLVLGAAAAQSPDLAPLRPAFLRALGGTWGCGGGGPAPPLGGSGGLTRRGSGTRPAFTSSYMSAYRSSSLISGL